MGGGGWVVVEGVMARASHVCVSFVRPFVSVYVWLLTVVDM